MGVFQWIAVVVLGLAAAYGAAWLVTGGHLFDGCAIHLESEASRDRSYHVDFKGRADAASGTLPPGAKADVKLCAFSPRNQPAGTLRVDGLGNATFQLDPFCDDWTFLVNDTSLVAASRACS